MTRIFSRIDSPMGRDILNGKFERMKTITKEFCEKRIREQNNYLDNLESSKLSIDRAKELYFSAYSIKLYWLDKYKNFE